MGVDRLQFLGDGAFSVADAVPAYAGLRYPHLKDESKPVQAKYQIAGKKTYRRRRANWCRRVEAITERS